MIPFKYTLPDVGELRVSGQKAEYLRFITETQLLDTSLWQHFVRVFQTKADTADRGWRGEYWGKMMRGACLVYRCTADERLYTVMREAILSLLDCAEADGRISTYTRETECSGWDLWCRKYVLTGMLHFCDICRDGALTDRILDSMEQHLSCLIARVGPGPGQIEITDTSDFWLGVNSCSILEAVLDLYRRRPKEPYLRFARYIVNTGGCRGDEDLIALALENKLAPYQYPENKAYETMSFFEGVLAYYETTGEQPYLDAVLNFTEKVFETDLTLIGCAGCTHELFDHSTVRQTEYSETIMQETCVTVTWMRLCARLFLYSGDEKYADRVEQSALNALYGSVNLYMQPFLMSDGQTVSPLPFDSYSPLYLNRRGRSVGGFKTFDDGSFYGCCAAIGAAGLAVYPLIDALRHKTPAVPELREHHLNGCIAFTYGPYVLARDAAKSPDNLSAPVCPKRHDGHLRYTLLPCEKGETVRLLLETTGGTVLLTDYASCGKRWAESDSVITVWMPSP